MSSGKDTKIEEGLLNLCNKCISERAVTLEEYLMPADGHGELIFPPTYSGGEGEKKKSRYIIDPLLIGGNKCIIDSFQSQAHWFKNFLMYEEKGLAPETVIGRTIKNGNIRYKDLLKLGHDVFDAYARCSGLQDDIIKALGYIEEENNFEPMAKISPMLILCGGWDSRNTLYKRGRIYSSRIDAFNVSSFNGGFQYKPAANYENEGLLPKSSKETKSEYSSRGFLHAIGFRPDGVIVHDFIKRRASISVNKIRLLRAGDDGEKTLKLQHYIFSLGLLAIARPGEDELRGGCNLVLDPERPRKLELVYKGGKREELDISYDEVLGYAKCAAEDFGINPSSGVYFNKGLAEKDVGLVKKNVEKSSAKKPTNSKSNKTKKNKNL